MGWTSVRSTLALSAVAPAFVVAAWSVGGAGTTPPTSDGERAGHVVDHEFGSTVVPADPSRVVAIDEYAALDLLSVGITPSVVFTTWGSEIARDVLEDAGAEIVDAALGDGVAAEAVLAEQPDLVVFTSIGDPSFYDLVAPAVATLPIPATTVPWRDKLAFLGEAFGRQERTADLTEALEARIETLQADAAWPATASVLMYSYGILAIPTGSAPSSQLFAELGIATPADQAAPSPIGSPYAPLSNELLADQDADLVVVFAEGVYDATAVRATPGFDDLAAGRAGDVVEVNGDMWFGTHAFAISWMLDDIATLVAHDLDGVATASDAADRFASFQALAAGEAG